MINNNSDSFLEERLNKYDKWVKEGKIPFSSKVIPIKAAVEKKQWILPTEQAIEILRNSRIFAVIDCGCRIRFKRCNNPLNVCFVINDIADKYIEEKIGRRITLQEAKKILKKANEHGLIHLTIYNPSQYVYAICSCCECCCHDLQFLKKYNRSDLIAHSDYYAETDLKKCNECGACIKPCIFNAREMIKDKLRIDKNKCYGCGLCVIKCPEDAINLELRKNKKNII